MPAPGTRSPGTVTPRRADAGAAAAREDAESAARPVRLTAQRERGESVQPIPEASVRNARAGKQFTEGRPVHRYLEKAAPDVVTAFPRPRPNQREPRGQEEQAEQGALPAALALKTGAEMSAQPEAPPAPVIRVTIDRVEIRAQGPPPAQPKQATRAPSLSLDEYLKRYGGKP